MRVRSKGTLYQGLALALLLCTATRAQQPAGVGIAVEFPQVGSLSISHAEVTFDLSASTFPPREFPGYYLPISPSEPMTFSVTSNASNWMVTAEFTGLFNVDENTMLAPDQLQYRIDGSDWFALGASAVTLAMGSASSHGPSATPQQHTLELRLVVWGTEAPGSYEGTLTFTLVTQ